MSVKARVRRGEFCWSYEVWRSDEPDKKIALGWDDTWRAAFDRALLVVRSIAVKDAYDQICQQNGLIQ